jgi:AcrR family transcriptional regulator
VAGDAVTPYAVAARELLRSTLLDAMRDQLRTRAWAEVTMAEVATAAGVSRQTLYKEFGSRHDLAQAYVLREVDRFLGAVEEAVTAHLHDPTTALGAAFDVFLAAAADDPLVRAVVSGAGGDELLPARDDAGPAGPRARDRPARRAAPARVARAGRATTRACSPSASPGWRSPSPRCPAARRA